MGNYKNIKIDFVERTLELISQYNDRMHRDFDFEKQYNHTLLINCMLGLIVMPVERASSFIPADRLTPSLKNYMGIFNSSFNDDINDFDTLIERLRNSVSHFDIRFESDDQETFLIDRIVFHDQIRANKIGAEDYIVASFVPEELLAFVRYYGGWIIHNLRAYDVETSYVDPK